MEALLEKRRGGLSKLLSNLRIAKSQWGLLFFPCLCQAEKKIGRKFERQASSLPWAGKCKILNTQLTEWDKKASQHAAPIP